MMQEIANHYIDQVAFRKYIDNIKTPYFVIRLGANGERIFAVSNYYDMNNETFLDEVVLTAMSSKNRTGEIDMYNLRYCFVDSPYSRYLLFSDISDEKKP